MKVFDALVAKYEAAMEDDFNTADAISAIFEIVKAANIHVTETSTAAFQRSRSCQKLSDCVTYLVLRLRRRKSCWMMRFRH